MKRPQDMPTVQRVACEDGFAVSMLGAEHLTSCFPTGRYRGISLLLDAEKAQAYLAEQHPELMLTLTELPGKYCPAGSCFTARTGEALRRAFRQIYDAPERLAFEARDSAGLVPPVTWVHLR